jgi:hypothetical protein
MIHHRPPLALDKKLQCGILSFHTVVSSIRGGPTAAFFIFGWFLAGAFNAGYSLPGRLAAIKKEVR